MPERFRYNTSEQSSLKVAQYNVRVHSHVFAEQVDACYRQSDAADSKSGIGAILEVWSTDDATWRIHLEYGNAGSFELVHFPTQTGILFIGDGAAYAIDLSRNKPVQPIHLWPIKGLLEDTSTEAILLYDHTDIVCVDGSGVRWRSGRLSWDGLRSLKIDGEQLTGDGWDAPENSWKQFSIKIKCGEVLNRAFRDEE